MSDFFKEYFGCDGPCPEVDRIRNFQPPQYITDLTNEFIGCLPDPAPFPCSAITDCALDTYVTGGTLTQPTNSTNDGFINLLYNANISASTYSLPYTDTFTTGGTYDNSTALITFIKNDSSQYTVDLSTIGGGSSGDTFVTGFTYNDANTFTISRNDGVDLTSSFNTVTGLTVNGTLDATTILSGGTNLTTIIESLDTNTFVSGGTYNTGTQEINFVGNSPETTFDVDLSSLVNNVTGDTFVTGFTYNNANTFTISRNDGVDLSASINTMTGLTINGTLVVDIFSATTFTGLTLNDLDDVTSNIPTTPDNTYQGRLLYFDVTDNQWVTGEEYVSTGNVTIWAKKGSAGTIDKGCPVYIVGFDSDIHEVELANATTASTMPVIGFTGEDFDNAGVYPLITFGKLVGVDTTSTVSTINPNGETWAVNVVLFMNTTDGGLTKFRPSGTNTQIQRIAKVLKVGSTDGQLFIFNTARTAGLPNLTSDYLWVGNGDDKPQEVIRTGVGITTTGFTYNNNNTFTITDDNGGSLSSTINQMSGLTINGELDVTGDTTLGPLTATSVTSNSEINVFNGHINIRDNSFFLQGRTVADVNVSLIGVDNQDRVFVGNAGYDTYIDSDTIVDGVLSAQTAFLTTTPTNNNSLTEILGRNSSTGEIEYRDVSTIGGGSSGDTFVTGFTYNDANTFTISRNDGVDISTSINIVTGLTVNGDIEMGNSSTRQIYSTGVSEISSIQYATSGTSVQMRWDGGGDSTVFSVNNTDFTSISSTKSGFGGIVYGADYSANYDDRSLIDLGFFNSNNRYVTGGTYDNGTALISYSGANGFPSFTVDLSSIDVNDTFSTGGTVTQNSSSSNPNQTIQIVGNDGFTPYNITNVTDTFTTGGTYNNGTALITFDKNDGTSYDVDLSTLDLNDTFVTGGTYSSNTLTLDRNDGNSVVVTGFTSGGSGVSSVTAGAGLSGDTTTGDITLINTAPDQTVTISGGTDIGVTGVYPNFSISYTGSPSGGLSTKAGTVAGSSFSGNPKKYTLTFGSSFADANYSISISSEINRNFTYESKTASGFVINANANASFTEDVDWICIKHGET